MNMTRRNNNRNNNRNNRGSGRRYHQGGGGNRQQNDGQNLQRQKHHATQMLGKYNDLLRNAQNNGDRVDVEYYLQHIDHYNRVLADIAGVEAERFAAQREAQIVPGGPNDPNASEGNAAAEGSADGAANPDEFHNNQPRMTRQPRRPYHQQQAGQQAGDAPVGAQASESSSNSEIPLPGSILPPI